MKKEKSAGAVIINKNNEILIIKHNQGHWSFPKGHIEKNETEKETALRKIKEETGLEVNLIENIKEISTYNPKKEIIKDVVFFLALSNDTKIKLQPSEVSDYKWLKYQECLNALTYEVDKIILHKIYSKYKKINK